MARLSLSLILLVSAVAGPAFAGEVACFFEGGVVVVPAEVAGVAGDYILDTGAPRTILAETQAQEAGFADTALAGDALIAGRRIPGLAITVKDLDVRTGLFPTPIAGVIGADALKAYVVDLEFQPCRLALRSPNAAPAFPARAVLPLRWIAGVPAVPAAVSDGPHALSGAFALATGSDTPVRLSDRLAAAPGAAEPRELYPYGVLRPRLRAFSFAGDIAEDVPAGLIAAPDPELAGEIGAPMLWAWRIRFDFPHRRLLFAAPVKGRR